MQKTIIAFLALAILATMGCASTPVTHGDAKALAADHRMVGLSLYSTLQEGKVRVTVVRDACILGALSSITLSIDGTQVAKIGDSESLELYMDPGEYIFSVVFLPRVANMLVEKMIEIKPGKPRAIRIALDSEGNPWLHDTLPPK